MNSYSNKNNVRYLLAFLKAAGISKIVISPGSRNAPLILSFTQDDFFSCQSMVDERSAGFFALGWGMATGEKIVLCCSSGTALLNYHPAIAEAYYQKIPLLVLSADRPAFWIDQNDGQTIHQKEVLSAHVGLNLEVEENESSFSLERKYNQMLWVLDEKMPVHLNLPFEEPLYILEKKPLPTIQKIEKISPEIVSKTAITKLNECLKDSQKTLLILGYGRISEEIKIFLQQLIYQKKLLVWTEISNHFEGALLMNDLLVNIDSVENTLFQPELVIIQGANVISRHCKEWLRKNRPRFNFVFHHFSKPVDLFLSATHHVQADFFETLKNLDFPINSDDFLQRWQNQNQKISTTIYSDLWLTENLLEKLPKNAILHLGNSMSVRYLSYFPKTNLACFANRGSSGIEGTLSTALGFYQADPSQEIFVVLGDLSFFYDLNASFLLNKTKIKVIILNNNGGNIFRMIAPTAVQDQKFYDFFETPNVLGKVDFLASRGLKYFEVHQKTDFLDQVDDFIHSPQAAILECFTDPLENKKVLEKIKN